MKKLLTGLLILGSFSVFSRPVKTVKVKNVEFYSIDCEKNMGGIHVDNSNLFQSKHGYIFGKNSGDSMCSSLEKVLKDKKDVIESIDIALQNEIIGAKGANLNQMLTKVIINLRSGESITLEQDLELLDI